MLYVSLSSWSTGGTQSIHPTQVIFVDNSWIRMVSKQQNADDRHATWHATCLVARKHVLHVEGWSFYRIAEVWRLPHDHSRLCGVGARETLCTVAPKPRLDRFCRWQPAGRQRYAQRDQIQLLAQRSEHGVGRHVWPAINYESHCIACCMLLVGDLTFCVNVPDCSWCTCGIYCCSHHYFTTVLMERVLHNLKGLPASIKNMYLEIWAPSCISQQAEATKSRRTPWWFMTVIFFTSESDGVPKLCQEEAPPKPQKWLHGLDLDPKAQKWKATMWLGLCLPMLSC